MRTNIVTEAFFLLAMFVLSGMHKILTFRKTVENFNEKVWSGTGNEILMQLIISIVIIIEILAPLVILYHLSFGNLQWYAYASIISLIVFTILATIIYHPPSFTNYYKSIPFWANVSLIGGLLLLHRVASSEASV